MKMQLQALCLATLGGAASLLVPGTAQAGNVGYYMACGSANPSSAITLAGHTPVSVTTLDSASLAPLDGLVIANCSGTYSGTPALNTAVAKSPIAAGPTLEHRH